MMNAFDSENLIPKCDTIVTWRLAKLFNVSTRHVCRLIQGGRLRVPQEELARVKRNEKPWTMLSIPRESVIEFIREGLTPAFRQNAQDEEAAQ
jgi:hypothetical protein